MELNISETDQKEMTSFFYRILIPRPIAWVSTRSKSGIDNLAPFHFMVEFLQIRQLFL